MPRRTPPGQETKDLIVRFRIAASEARDAKIAAELDDRSVSDLLRLGLRDRVRAMKKKHPGAFPKEPTKP